MPLAQIIDVEALGLVVAASVVAGGGLVLLFSIGILSAAHAAEMRRRGSGLAAAVLGAVALVGFLACVALVAFGIYLIAAN